MFCLREAKCGSTTPSLVLVPVFSPRRAAFCCPSDQRRGVVQLPKSLRRSAAHVATEHATVALSAAQQHSVWLVVVGGAWCLVLGGSWLVEEKEEKGEKCEKGEKKKKEKGEEEDKEEEEEKEGKRDRETEGKREKEKKREKE